MALWQKLTKPRDLDLKWLANNEVQVLIDKDRIAQVLTILIENAHKYSYPDTPIVLRVESEGPNINVSVIDSGEGISSSDLQHVFERFVRLKRKGNGMGLGLSIAKAIAEAHHGTLSAHSTLGKGSQFTLTLPVLQDHATRA
jgi:signal transduction histidine kinase